MLISQRPTLSEEVVAGNRSQFVVTTALAVPTNTTAALAATCRRINFAALVAGDLRRAEMGSIARSERRSAARSPAVA